MLLFVSTHKHRNSRVVNEVVTHAPKECSPHFTHTTGPHYYYAGILFLCRAKDCLPYFTILLFHMSAHLKREMYIIKYSNSYKCQLKGIRFVSFYYFADNSVYCNRCKYCSDTAICTLWSWSERLIKVHSLTSYASISTYIKCFALEISHLFEYITDICSTTQHMSIRV